MRETWSPKKNEKGWTYFMRFHQWRDGSTQKGYQVYYLFYESWWVNTWLQGFGLLAKVFHAYRQQLYLAFVTAALQKLQKKKLGNVSNKMNIPTKCNVNTLLRIWRYVSTKVNLNGDNWTYTLCQRTAQMFLEYEHEV